MLSFFTWLEGKSVGSTDGRGLTEVKRKGLVSGQIRREFIIMISYRRKVRLRDLEIYFLFKDSLSMGYLIIEDLRRPLGKEELELDPYKYMDLEDIQEYQNVIKIDVLSDEKLCEEDQDIFREFAMNLVDCKDFCALKLDFHVNAQLLGNLLLDNEPGDYQSILNEINSKYDILNLKLDNLLYLSQD